MTNPLSATGWSARDMAQGHVAGKDPVLAIFWLVYLLAFTWRFFG